MNISSPWERFVYFGDESNDIRKEVLDSWNRCKQFGLSPEMEHVSYRVDINEFNRQKDRNSLLLKAAVPIMDELYSSLKGGGYLLMLADAQGYLLNIMADTKAQKAADRTGISRGARWVEDTVGSTGLSIALKTRTAIATTAFEHYCQAFRIWDCSACPIYVDGDFVGVFDICRIGPGNDVRELYTLAVSGARSISERIIYEKVKIQKEIVSSSLSHFIPNTGVISFDKWGTVGYTNKIADNFINSLRNAKKIVSNMHTADKTFSVLSQLKIPGLKNEEIAVDGIRYYLESDEIKNSFQETLGVSVYITTETKTSERRDLEHEKDNRSDTLQPLFETRNPTFSKTLSTINKIAKSDAAVLLQGETGSGKDFIARLIHEQSDRRKKPFIAVNCASLPKDLISTELFGYAHGAFTGAKQQGNPGKIESANGGILFLDEIADMPLDLQAILLRTLEERQVTRLGSSKPIAINVRFLAATHKNLENLVEKGEFRQDLYYRLNIFQVRIPALRERKEDIELLLERMLTESCRKAERAPFLLTRDAIDFLNEYSWPGNLRELKNLSERLAYLHDGEKITAVTISSYLNNVKNAAVCEKDQLEFALHSVNGNRAEAARQLNISRSALYRKLRKYGIE